jgi:single-stranded-DNA-specific exonuclease
MIYKQKTNLQATEHFLEDFLKERRIENLQTFLHPTAQEQHDFMLLDNIISAAKCLIEHVENNDNIFIQIDSDTDGYTSAAIMYLYIKKMNPSIVIDWRVHEGKQHGLIVDTIPDDTQLVIAPDSSSNDYQQHLELKERGIDVIVLDHHMSDDGYSKNAIVVNNQLSESYPNKSLCGAGVTYKFCCCLDSILGTNYAYDFIDLAAVGMIGDMMELCDLETRYIVNEGLTHISNFGIQAMVDKQSFSMGNKITPIGIAFYIVPLINALIRVGTQEEKEVLFKALVNPLLELPSTKRGHKPGDTETACAQAVRICTNAKNRQDRLKLKVYDNLDFKIQALGLDEHKIIIVEVEREEEFDNTLTGLVAMQLVTKYKKPVCVVRENSDGYLRGSARGVSHGPIPDLRQFFMDSGYFDYAIGHPNAHGVSIHRDRLDNFLSYADRILADVDFNENVYEVDLIINGENPNLSDIILSLGNLAEIWGQGMEEPLIAIENLQLNSKNVQLIGNDKTTVKFTINGITYIKFKDEALGEKLLANNTMNVTVLGRANINEWMGNKTAQIIIENYEIKDTTYEF